MTWCYRVGLKRVMQNITIWQSWPWYKSCCCAFANPGSPAQQSTTLKLQIKFIVVSVDVPIQEFKSNSSWQMLHQFYTHISMKIGAKDKHSLIWNITRSRQAGHQNSLCGHTYTNIRVLLRVTDGSAYKCMQFSTWKTILLHCKTGRAAWYPCCDWW